MAALASAANRTPARGMVTGSVGTCNDGGIGGVPLGCSAQTGSWSAHYKTGGVNCNSGYSLVCSGSSATYDAVQFLILDILCDRLLQQFHRVDEELSIQGKWQGGSVTGVCRGWGTNKVRLIVHS